MQTIVIVTSAELEVAGGINDSWAAPPCCPLLWELGGFCPAHPHLHLLPKVNTGFDIFPFNSHQNFFSSQTFSKSATEWERNSKYGFQSVTFFFFCLIAFR